MYFGFSNAPVTFQSMMNNILGDLIHIRLVMVYLDDILIFGTCLKKYRRLVKEVLKRLHLMTFTLKQRNVSLNKVASNIWA